MKVPKEKAKRLSIILFGVGGWGTIISLLFHNSFLLFLAGINIALGVVFVFQYYKEEGRSIR